MAKFKQKVSIKPQESSADWLKRVYASEGAEHFIGANRKSEMMDDYRGVSGISPTEYSDFMLGGDGKHDPFVKRGTGKNVPNGWTPRMEQVPQNVTFKDDGQININRKFTAGEKKQFGVWLSGPAAVPAGIPYTAAKTTRGVGGVFLWAKYWQNPYQYQDYLVLQDNYANTIAGRILDVIVYFALANGIIPKLVPKDKAKFKTQEELTQALAKAKWVTQVFEQIDAKISENQKPEPYSSFDDEKNLQYLPIYSVEQDKNAPTYDTPLQDKWASFATLGLNFGRCAMVPNVDPDDNTVEFKVDGQDHKYVGIPKVYQIIHPRDMGFNHVDPITWKLRGIQVYNSNWILKPNQMLFLEWGSNSPVYGSMYYGYSALQSMMGSARTLRRVIEVDFPLIAKTRWSGMYWIFFKRKGEGISTVAGETNAILRSMKIDGINISLEDKPLEDVKIEKIDLDPKINELIEMCKFNIQYMMSQVSMPQGLLFGEQDLNRDTLKTGIQTFTKGPVKKYRRWILRAATENYRRIAATIIPQNEAVKEVLEDFDIVATVKEFNLESSVELANSLMVLENAVGSPFTLEAKAEFMEMDDLASMIDPKKGPDDLPPMPGGGSMNIKDKQTGKEFDVKS